MKDVYKSKVENYSVKDKHVLVIGLGYRTGLAAANFLASSGARVAVSDVKSAGELADVISRLDRSVRVYAGNQDPSLLDEGIELVVLSPGVPSSIPLVREARRRRVPVIAEIELAYRFIKGKIVAITGTDGKSTTTSLVAHILKDLGYHATPGGNIGIPLISLVGATTEGSISVVELSSFQLETVERFRPEVAAILNVSPDHLDRYSGIGDYFEAKRRIALNQKENDFFIYNYDDSMIRSGLGGIASQTLCFSLIDPEADAFLDGGTLLLREGGKAVPVLDVADLRIVGIHNAMNAMAAVLMVRSVLQTMNEPMDMAAVRSACCSFRGLNHRMEVLGEVRKRIFINDSKATTVGAVEMALRSLPAGKVILILGGRTKGDDYSRLAGTMKGRVKGLVLIGESGEEFSRLFSGFSRRRAADMDGAVRAAMEESAEGDMILLSPACASFDMFRNFEERGDHFRKSVERLMEEPWI